MALAKLTRAQLALRKSQLAGSLLSNIAYNCAQRDDVPTDVRAACALRRKEWDALQTEVREALRVTARKPQPKKRGRPKPKAGRRG